MGISAGYVAFITLLGVFEKLATKRKIASNAKFIESSIILGVTLGNTLFLLSPSLHLGTAFLYFFNLLGGIFTGCLVGALAETLNVFPILSRRIGVRKYLPYVLLAAAIGKALGCFINLTYLQNI